MTERTDELRELLTCSDAELARMDLDVLLDRVRAILHADTAAVLIREPGALELTARAACGLAEEVRQGVRVPVGAGFAGRIAATRQPVILDRVDASTATNPILWLRGIRRMLGVPLLVDGELLGVLHVGRLHDRGFREEDVTLLQAAGERVAGAIHVRHLADEAAAASLLERGLLPTRLPRLPGIEFAARYVPAESRAIGGDWYDVFVLPNGTLWLVTGDVAGHGVNAAVVMGRVKSALRAYAMLDEQPNRVVELTDRKLQHFEIGTIVTLICAVAEPPYDQFAICSAGHPPPVLAVPGQQTELLELPVGPPLGAVRGVERAVGRVRTPPGSVLALYTDGLVERRRESIDVGLHRLCAAVLPEDAETVCRTVMRQLVGDQPVTDDIALLVLHHTS